MMMMMMTMMIMMMMVVVVLGGNERNENIKCGQKAENTHFKIINLM